MYEQQTEEEQAVLGSNNVNRLHFSRESTGSRQTAPGSLWSEPSACWSSSVSEQMKNVWSIKSHRLLNKKIKCNGRNDRHGVCFSASLRVPGRHLSTHIQSGAPDWRSCEELTSWTVDEWSRSGPAPPPDTWQSGDYRAELDRRKMTVVVVFFVVFCCLLFNLDNLQFNVFNVAQFHLLMSLR